MTCKVGGLVTLRHDEIRDWLRNLIEKALGLGVGAVCEQFVSRWNRVKPDGSVEQARLDVIYTWQGRRVYVDLAFVARSRNGAALRSRAARDGAAVEREEGDKGRRYPGPDLRPLWSRP
jgi:hypothetical protein